MNRSLAKYIRSVSELQKIVFSVYIEREYFVNYISYEKKLIRQSREVMRALQKVRISIKDNNILAHLESLYEIIFSLDILKNRLIDHSTFEICEHELKNVSLSISLVLSDLADKKPVTEKKSLDVAIESLEIIFQNTLQVVTADPMVFLFFIRDLHALNDVLGKLQFELVSGVPIL